MAQMRWPLLPLIPWQSTFTFSLQMCNPKTTLLSTQCAPKYAIVWNISCSVQSNYCGIFATHQHDIIDPRVGLLTQLKHCNTYRMSVVPWPPPPPPPPQQQQQQQPFPAPAGLASTSKIDDKANEGAAQLFAGLSNSSSSSRHGKDSESSTLQPTFQVQEGASTESMAFQVAIDQVRTF
jgi:hypothetical protein